METQRRRAFNVIFINGMAPRRGSLDILNPSYFRTKDFLTSNQTNSSNKIIERFSSTYSNNQKELRRQLQLISAKARTYKVAETQTAFELEMLEDAIDEQNEPKVMRIRLLEMLALNRRLVSKNQKLEDDAKSLEQRLQTEYQTNLEKVKEEAEKNLQFMLEEHNKELVKLKSRFKEEVEKKEKIIRFTRLEVTKLNEEVDKHERVAKQTKNDIIKLEAENRILTDENKSLRRNIQLVNVESKLYLQKEAAYIESLTRKCAESEKAKKVIIENFRHLEKERDNLAALVKANINLVRKSNEEKSKKLIKKIAMFEHQLDKYELP
ncbi:unnamed protein product [Enterobius vermicularis]|uniref:Cilia- and flagella-associated protein 157 n=1 Tax=Enterobius vermicularis TaxID=51028 RepID=A0A158Q977_ENTVE|nr:unnamed protein product [Enterobius vermicularis]